jgi:hypothetical protein
MPFKLYIINILIIIPIEIIYKPIETIENTYKLGTFTPKDEFVE